jgi:hypothetical protein
MIRVNPAEIRILPIRIAEISDRSDSGIPGPRDGTGSNDRARRRAAGAGVSEGGGRAAGHPGLDARLAARAVDDGAEAGAGGPGLGGGLLVVEAGGGPVVDDDVGEGEAGADGAAVGAGGAGEAGLELLAVLRCVVLCVLHAPGVHAVFLCRCLCKSLT